MSRYTIELRSLVNLYGRDTIEGWFKDYELSDYLTQEQIETITVDSVWSKDRLARDIVDKYFMREIGAETPALFRHYAKTTMREIMEDKLQLLYSTAMKYNVLDANDYVETLERETSASTSSQTSTEGSGLSVNSDTPQGQINKQAILGGSYASNTGATETESSASDSSSSSGAEEYTRRIKGRNGKSGAEMVAEYRKNILAINKDIINKLDILFMGIF